MKRALVVLVLLGSSFACDDIDAALEKRRAADGGTGGGGGGGSMGGGGGSMGGGGGDDLDSGMPMGGGIGPLNARLCPFDACWENPLPQGNTLTAVWGRNADDVWMVGEVGTVLRWQNGIWQSHQPLLPRNQTLQSIWGTADKLWVVGTPEIGNEMDPMRFDFGDAGWHSEGFGPGAPQLLSIRGTDENNVWASGFNGLIAKRTQSGWQSSVIHQGLPNLRALAFDSTGECRVALENGMAGVGPCDGGTLELTLSATDDDISNNGLWSPAPGVFYAAGVNMMPNYEGRIWAREDGGWAQSFQGNYNCSAGFGQGSFGFAFCGNGAAIRVPGYATIDTGLDPNDQFSGAWSPGTLEGSWLVGVAGAMSRHDSSGWVPMQEGAREAVFSLWVDRQSSFAGASNNVLFTRGADTKWSINTFSGGEGDFRGVWFDPDGYRALVGSNRMLLEGDSIPSQAPGVPTDAGAQLNGIWGTGKEDLWAVGNDGELWHRTDAGWSVSSLYSPGTGPTLWAIDGLDENTAYISGSSCTVLVRAPASDGGWVRSSPSCTSALFGIWAAPPNDAGLEAVAVGPNNRAFFRTSGQWNPSAFDPLQQPPSALHSVWGTSPNQIFAVGDQGALMLWNGTRWTLAETGTRNNLYTVRGRVLAGGGVELFMAGDYGTILRRVFP